MKYHEASGKEMSCWMTSIVVDSFVFAVRTAMTQSYTISLHPHTPWSSVEMRLLITLVVIVRSSGKKKLLISQSLFHLLPKSHSSFFIFYLLVLWSDLVILTPPSSPVVVDSPQPWPHSPWSLSDFSNVINVFFYSYAFSGKNLHHWQLNYFCKVLFCKTSPSLPPLRSFLYPLFQQSHHSLLSMDTLDLFIHRSPEFLL